MLLRTLVPLEQLGSEGMQDTPVRMHKALEQLCSGYKVDPGKLLKLFPADGYDQIITLVDMPFVSLCEHHVLPFSGTVSVGYLPDPKKNIVGLSKIPRVVRAITRRLQIQERITQEIAKAFGPVEAKGVAVLVRAHHTCMSMRGIESAGVMVTSVVEGVFRSDPSAKAEVMELLR